MGFLTERIYILFGVTACLAISTSGWGQAIDVEQSAPEVAYTGPVVFIIPFKGEVELGLKLVLERGFVEAEANRATYILLEMDTPGGRVDAALEIVDLILESKIPIAIYVTGNEGATSAGAIISLAADKVFMSPDATIGTAAPVIMGGEESETLNAKALSYVLAKVRRICEQKGYSKFKTELALAMVDKDMEVIDEKTGEVISKQGSLLTFTANEAAKYGFITAVAKTREEVLEKIGLSSAKIVYRQEHMFEQLGRFLSSTAISSLLLTLAFLGIFIEFRTPGFGLPGIIGLLSLALFFWGHSLVGLAGWEAPMLFMIGIVLLAVEFFVIPGFGLTGIAGFICVLASVVITLMEQSISSPLFIDSFDWEDFMNALKITLFSLLLGGTLGFLTPFLFPAIARTNVGGLIFLHEREDRTRGYQSAPQELEELTGKTGTTKSTLRPAGIAEIEGKRIDVVSEGGFIPSNTSVIVTKVEGRRVVVRAA